MDRLPEASALLTVTAPTTPLHTTLTTLIVIARRSAMCRSATLLKASEAPRAMGTCAGENKGRVERRRYLLVDASNVGAGKLAVDHLVRRGASQRTRARGGDRLHEAGSV